MGHPGKYVRIRRPYRLPMAAAPTLLGLAAAGLCLSAQAAPAGAATVTATAQHAVAAVQADSSSARLMSVARYAAAHEAHLAHVAHEAHMTVQAATEAASAATYSGGGSFQSCVIARESGGNAQVMNSSGHYGLYQFSYATWVAYGGSPASFGHASVAEQNQVFNNAIAAGGQSNWSAYDGC
jgi:Transglycosylase-like domain